MDPTLNLAPRAAANDASKTGWGTTIVSIPERLRINARSKPNQPAYYVKQRGVWRGTGYSEYWDQVKSVAKAMIASGLEPGFKVCILGANSPHWVIFDLGAMTAGGAPAGIYQTSSPGEAGYILEHTEARLCLVDSAAQLAKLRVERDAGRIQALEHVVTVPGVTVKDALAISWESFIARGARVSDEEVNKRLAALKANDVATLIYTSGTTGPPKGVMLSHENLAWTSKTLNDIKFAAGIKSEAVSISYLPLSHIAEQVATIHGPIQLGGTVYYAEAIEKLKENLIEVRPTLFFAVPRVWEKFYVGIRGRLEAATGAKAAIAKWAMGVGARALPYKVASQPLPPRLALENKIASRLVFSKLKHAIGLDRCETLISGAAPVSREILDFFGSLDIVIREIYGQSEDTGPTSFNAPGGATRLGSVGKPIPGLEVRLADDGEIWVRGPNVFVGYFKDEAATRETLTDDGWLKSGDLGSFDSDGYLTITGRKKEIIITAGGKNITPRNIEDALKKRCNIVGEPVVIGDKRKYLAMLVTLEPEALAKLCAAQGIDPATAHSSAAVKALVQKALDEVNAELARVEQVKRFVILPSAFSIESGELTPSLKLKRRVVAQKFAAEIESLYVEE